MGPEPPFKSMCYGGLCSLCVDDMLHLFRDEKWHYECASESFVCHSPSHYDLHAQSPCVDEFRDVCDHHCFYPRDVCSYCQFFHHDENSCPGYDVSNEEYTRLNTMVEIMTKQHKQFVSEIRECDFLHETNPSLPCPRLGASLHDDYEFFFPLESNVVNDAPLTHLEEVFDPLYLLAPSFPIAPIDTSVSDLALLASPLPLAQCIGLEVNEISRVMLVP